MVLVVVGGQSDNHRLSSFSSFLFLLFLASTMLPLRVVPSKHYCSCWLAGSSLCFESRDTKKWVEIFHSSCPRKTGNFEILRAARESTK